MLSAVGNSEVLRQQRHCVAHVICAGFHLIALATSLPAETKFLATVNTYVI